MQLAQVSEYPAEEIEIGLRLIGFREVVPALGGVLSVAAQLGNELSCLRAALPGLGTLIDRFLMVGRLAELLPNTAYPQHHATSEPIELRGRLLPGLLADPVSPALIGGGIPDHCRGVLAIQWLVQALALPVGGSSIQGLAELKRLPDPGLLYHVLNYLREDGVVAVWPALAEVGLWGWLDTLEPILDSNELVHRYGVAWDANPIALLRALLQQWEANAIPASSLHSPEATESRPWSLPLSERFLTEGHWYFPRPAELKALQNLLFSSAEPLDRSSPNFYETLLIVLGLVTGKTVQEVLNLEVLGTQHAQQDIQSDALVVEVRQGHQMYNCYVWQIPLASHAKPLRLPLPERAAQALREVVARDTRTTLCKLLPLTSRGWDARCLQLLAATLACTPRRAKLILRDSLLRASYQALDSRAVVSWLGVSRLPRERGSQVAMVHYLNPFAKRTVESYQAACKRLLGKTGKIDQSLAPSHTDHGIGRSDQADAAGRLRSAMQTSNLIEQHNAFARYSLMLLIAATGHRKSRTPFHFPWDLDLEQQVAFIADKCIVGSEARFVPLATVAVAQVRAYLRHLKLLFDQGAQVQATVRAHIRGLLQVGPNGQSSVCPDPSVGLFFLIRGDGTVEPMTTGYLGQWFKGTGQPVSIGHFRAALADCLWGKLSGWDVAALLGHANDLHPFGAASNWSVLDWADRVRPYLDEYLAQRGWVNESSPLLRASKPHNADQTANPIEHIFASRERVMKSDPFPDVAKPPGKVLVRLPTLVIGGASYEGRRREKALAHQRVRQAMKQVLSDERWADADLWLDEVAVKTIQGQVERIVSQDKVALGMVPQELKSWRAALLERGKLRRSPSSYQPRIDPSPVELSFGRHLAIAAAFLQQWRQAVGTTIGGSLGLSERAAQLAISLVVLDGQLDPLRVQATLEAVLSQSGLYIYPNVIVVRAEIKTPQFEYTWSTIPGSVSSALILGMQKDLATLPTAPLPTWRELAQHIKTMCLRLSGNGRAGAPADLDSLCRVFRPWWFLRLPGALYSIAIGGHNGPAPHERSEFSLFASQEPGPIALPLAVVGGAAVTETMAARQGAAIRAFQSLFASARGQETRGTAHTRRQRAALAKSLDSGANPELTHWRQQQPVVDYLIGFVESLLHFGGDRKEILRFSTINSYMSLAPTLIRLGWDCDPADMDGSALWQLYQQVEQEQKNNHTHWRMVLRLFHRYLRDNHDAPAVAAFAKEAPLPSRCRSSLVTAAAFDQALTTLPELPSIPGGMLGQTRVLLVLGMGYGARVMECMGLGVDHFDQKDSDVLTIQRNTSRDLKTANARRVIYSLLLNPEHKRALTVGRNRAAAAPGQSAQRLFGVPVRDQQIESKHSLLHWGKAALRVATGNDIVVFHDLRRTWATKWLMTSFSRRSAHPALKQAWDRLFGEAPPSLGDAYALTRTGTGSPFVVDGIARVLGHGSEDTLLNVYFHGAAIVLADRAALMNGDLSVTDAQVGGMLNRVRSAVTNLRSRLTNATSAPVTFDMVVRHYVSLAVEPCPADRPARKANAPSVGQTRSFDIPWIYFDRLLCQRQREQWSLSEMLECGHHAYGLAESAIEQFLVCYRKLLEDAGFDDFEPQMSELFYTGPLRSRGVARGAMEREAALQTMENWVRCKPDGHQALVRLVEAWADRVNPAEPWMVCRSLEDFEALQMVLQALGASAGQIYIEAVGSDTDPLIATLRQRGYSIQMKTKGRFSRGVKGLRVTEVGVAIRQQRCSTVPDGRDFHRLMAVMACLLPWAHR